MKATKRLGWPGFDGTLERKDFLSTEIIFILVAIPLSLLLFPRGISSGRDLVAPGGLILLFSSLPALVVGFVIGAGAGPKSRGIVVFLLCASAVLLGLFTAFIYLLSCVEFGFGAEEPCNQGWLDWMSALVGGQASLGFLWGVVSAIKGIRRRFGGGP